VHTRICDLFGIEYPIFAFTHCRDVVAAVSKAGGLGVLGAVGYSPEQLEMELTWIDEHVDGKPYGAVAERTGEVFDPATGALTGRVDFATTEVMDEAVAKIASSFTSSSTTTAGTSNATSAPATTPTNEVVVKLEARVSDLNKTTPRHLRQLFTNEYDNPEWKAKAKAIHQDIEHEVAKLHEALKGKRAALGAARPLTAPPSTSTAPSGREGDAFSAFAVNLV
jgi:NAD(P)H-dependent flavin oxidoreductase YrpB (nitropropane dioxygenase family)